MCHRAKKRPPFVHILSQINFWIRHTILFLTFMLLLFSHLWPDRPRGFFPQVFPSKWWTRFRPSPPVPHTLQIRSPWSGYRRIFGEVWKWWSSTLRNFCQFPCLFLRLRANELLSTLFSNILNLCPYFNKQYQVWNPWNTTGKIIILCIIILIMRPERDADPSPPSSAEVKNRVGLYLSSA